MAGRLVRVLRQGQGSALLTQNLPGLHQEPHQTAYRQHPADEAHNAGFAGDVSGVADQGPGRPHRIPAPAQGPECENGAESEPDHLLGHETPAIPPMAVPFRESNTRK